MVAEQINIPGTAYS